VFLLPSSFTASQGDGYVARGYADTGSPCDTLEFAMDDWCASRLAAGTLLLRSERENEVRYHQFRAP
jgi:hypothetical protein